jgi:hypothetical protein
LLAMQIRCVLESIPRAPVNQPIRNHRLGEDAIVCRSYPVELQLGRRVRVNVGLVFIDTRVIAAPKVARPVIRYYPWSSLFFIGPNRRATGSHEQEAYYDGCPGRRILRYEVSIFIHSLISYLFLEASHLSRLDPLRCAFGTGYEYKRASSG